MSKYIHYFVGKNKEIPPFSEKCLNSWKEYMSEEYEIKLWTLDDLYTIDDDIAVEIARIDNYNISKDFLEIYALYKYGGIYVDQNIKIVEPICDLLANSNSFLGMDERHRICSNIWYEKNAKSDFSQRVYECFKEKMAEGEYNPFFVGLQFIFKEVLNDFDFTNKKTQYLDNGVVVYSCDYFYPLSYDGHTKSISKNTRTKNYFHYDFITLKGRLKNIIYSIFGSYISTFLFSVARMLKKVIKILLFPLLKFKEFRKKDNQKHRELLQLTLNEIDSCKNKDYVAFHNPAFTGVSSATVELFENSVPCGELISSKEIKMVRNRIKSNNIKEVIFSGFVIGWYKLAKLLHKDGVVVKTYFHGSHSQYLDEYGWKMNKQIYLLEKKNIVSEMAFCKESIIDFYKDKGCNATFLKNLVNINFDINKKKKDKNRFVIGVYAVQATNTRKNVFSSLASAYFVGKEIKDKEVVLDIVPRSETTVAFCHLLGIKTTGVDKGIPREQLLNRMSNTDINLYVTFSECAPMVPLESFYVGVPCLTGNNHHYFKNSELEQYLVVNNENNPLDIYKKIIYCNDNRKKVLKLYDEFSVKNLNSGKELVKHYIELGDNSD